jgi:hypothetical protein
VRISAHPTPDKPHQRPVHGHRGTTPARGGTTAARSVAVSDIGLQADIT